MWNNFKNGWFSFVKEITSPFSTETQKDTKIQKTKEPIKVKKLQKVKKKNINTTIEKKVTINEEPQIIEEYTQKIEPVKQYNIDSEYIETPTERLDRIRRTKPTKIQTMSGKRRELLFINPGTERIKQATWALKNNGVLPDWATRFTKQLKIFDNKLYFEDLPMVTNEEKRDLIKREYYDPSGQSTIHGIQHVLKTKYANISRSNIQKILRSFETYQLNFRRRKPPKVLGRMTLKKPGVIACDMFFPSKLQGWEKSNVLVMMDCYSRYVQAYNLEKKNETLVEIAMNKFFQSFLSLGQLPSVIICDKGTDLAPAKKVMEKFRNGRKGDLVLHSKTGQPVNIVEAMNSQLQRRMAVFRTSGITSNPGLILEQICDSINKQPRPIRSNMTPLQLLKLDKEGRNRVNANYKIPSSDSTGLKELFIGSHVRTLVMTMKEQLKDSVKGFAPKWSKDVYVVTRKRALPGNINNFRYFLKGLTEGYFRHELLWIPPNVDSEVYDMVDWKKDASIYEDFSE